jgi:excisionase family DNA binding protein
MPQAVKIVSQSEEQGLATLREQAAAAEWLTFGVQSIDLMTQTFEPLLSDAQAGELLRLHPKTVQRLARAKQLPAVGIGRYWRFRASAFNEWIDIHSTCQPLTERTQ